MEYRVVIPDEVFAILEWQDEGLPVICVVNQSLVNFEPKVAFGWHLSIIVACEQLAGSGMPTPEERRILDEFGDELDQHLKAKSNALFLARTTWNGSRQLLYRVYDPEVANEYLASTIDGKFHARNFEYRMEHDGTWELAKHLLSRWVIEPGATTDRDSQ